jgi:hypothetical protein
MMVYLLNRRTTRRARRNRRWAWEEGRNLISELKRSTGRRERTIEARAQLGGGRGRLKRGRSWEDGRMKEATRLWPVAVLQFFRT